MISQTCLTRVINSAFAMNVKTLINLLFFYFLSTSFVMAFLASTWLGFRILRWKIRWITYGVVEYWLLWRHELHYCLWQWKIQLELKGTNWKRTRSIWYKNFILEFPFLLEFIESWDITVCRFYWKTNCGSLVERTVQWIDGRSLVSTLTDADKRVAGKPRIPGR